MKRLMLILSLFLLLITALGVQPASADSNPAYNDQIGQQIIQNCAVIQNTLSNLRQRDISSRVAHVYVYEFLLQRTDAFASRLGNNHLSHDNIDNDNKTISSHLTKFKNDYDSYDQALTTLQAVNCQNSPQDFFNKLGVAQSKREQLQYDIANLEQDWTQLVNDIANIKLTKPATSPTAGGGA